MYPWFNVILVDLFVAIDSVIVIAMNRMRIADGYKIALLPICVLSLIAKVVLGILSPQIIYNNLFLLIVVAIFLFEVAIVAIFRLSSHYVSANTDHR